LKLSLWKTEKEVYFAAKNPGREINNFNHLQKEFGWLVMTGNPNIVEIGRATRFGAGNCPRVAQSKANKPWTFRRAARLLGGTPLPRGEKDHSLGCSEAILRGSWTEASHHG
jgi:hypothetical protein